MSFTITASGLADCSFPEEKQQKTNKQTKKRANNFAPWCRFPSNHSFERPLSPHHPPPPPPPTSPRPQIPPPPRPQRKRRKRMVIATFVNFVSSKNMQKCDIIHHLFESGTKIIRCLRGVKRVNSYDSNAVRVGGWRGEGGKQIINLCRQKLATSIIAVIIIIM